MTPKEKYDARKAERDKRRADAEQSRSRSEIDSIEIMETLDRIATAFERIADSMDRP